MLGAAVDALKAEDFQILAVSRLIESAPVGPSLRRYANGAAVVETALDPRACLAALKAIERRSVASQAGSAGRRACSTSTWCCGAAAPGTTSALVIPHPAFRNRDFVLRPAAQIARDWRDPRTTLTIAHLAARLTRRRATPR